MGTVFSVSTRPASEYLEDCRTNMTHQVGDQYALAEGLSARILSSTITCTVHRIPMKPDSVSQSAVAWSDVMYDGELMVS
jgi:hypothetical protein